MNKRILNILVNAKRMTKLVHAWDVYYRMPSCTDWSIQGYTLFQKGIQTAEELVYILSNLNDHVGIGCLPFIMKEGILPIWECADNIDGGVFSFGISDIQTWKNVVYSMCGNTLFTTETNNQAVNGISLLYKKGTLVFKLWFRNDQMKTLTDITFIPGVNPADSHFQYHHIPTAIATPKPRPVGIGTGKVLYQGQGYRPRHSDSRQGHSDSRQGHSDSRQRHSDSRQGHSDSRQGHSDSRQGHSDSRQPKSQGKWSDKTNAWGKR